MGDLVDRGPNTPGVLRLVMSLVAAGAALCVPGNHDMKLLRKLKGRNVQITHGLAASLEQLAAEPPAFVEQVIAFLDGLVSHYVLDDGKLVVAHAGMQETMQGRASGKVRAFALYGETTGETDEFGLPIRYNWAAEYRGKAMVVYGHTPVPEPTWLNHTINIDTGCVYGGRLTALRYPEKELVSVPAAQTYYVAVKPFMTPPASGLTAQQQHDDMLDIDDVLGKRIIHTRLHHNVTIREEQAITALEVMSRFAANPKWLIYLPPTMSPCETSQEPEWLEHPAEAFAYYRHQGVARVVCEEKHMGSRAVVIVCRDADVAQRRFGVSGEGQWYLLHSHWPALLQRPGTRSRLARPGASCDGGYWTLGDTQHRLDLSGLRAAALVRQSPGPAAPAVRCSWECRASRIGRGGGRVGAIRDACRPWRDVPPAPLPRTRRHGGRLCRGVSTLLLGGALC